MSATTICASPAAPDPDPRWVQIASVTTTSTSAGPATIVWRTQ